MGRAQRVDLPDYCYHIVNRANARLPLFFGDSDYQMFEEIIEEACEKYSMRLLGYCVMPNHFHLLLYPSTEGNIQRFMQWVTLTHTQRWHVKNKTVGSGHLYQGRYKSFIIQTDNHVLSVLRYIERNPLRAKLVRDLMKWKHSSYFRRAVGTTEQKKLLSKFPVDLPKNYSQFILEPMTNAELEEIRLSNKKGLPYGTSDWQESIVTSCNLKQATRERGRPKKN